MTFKTKYEIGDEVYYESKDAIFWGKIVLVEVRHNVYDQTNISYTVQGRSGKQFTSAEVDEGSIGRNEKDLKQNMMAKAMIRINNLRRNDLAPIFIDRT